APAVSANDKAKLTKPARAHAGDAGYDLALAGTQPVVLTPGGRATVPTGWTVRLDPATCGLILPRSGNASKLGLNVITGVVDAGYAGELKVTVHNTSRDKVTLTPGMRIAQLVATPVVNYDPPAKKTERGARGFGSTDTAVGGDLSERRGTDTVNHPAHYTLHPVFTGECHDYAKYMTFDQGNAFKYLWRCAAKGDMTENVRKALW
ncbi:dUTP diphosphatase, partial [Rhizobium leguminosarum]|uniref:dUTP diphosphatase n=1 Tax=Rhizobium ruizarguesonis TaxID=2081791 RepID=UPI0013BBF597